MANVDHEHQANWTRLKAIQVQAESGLRLAKIKYDQTRRWVFWLNVLQTVLASGTVALIMAGLGANWGLYLGLVVIVVSAVSGAMSLTERKMQVGSAHEVFDAARTRCGRLVALMDARHPVTFEQISEAEDLLRRGESKLEMAIPHDADATIEAERKAEFVLGYPAQDDDQFTSDQNKDSTALPERK